MSASSTSSDNNNNNKFQLFAALPPEITHRILLDWMSGKNLSTFALAVAASRQVHHEKVHADVVKCGLARIKHLADYIESKSSVVTDGDNGKVDALVEQAVRWIRSIIVAPKESNDSSSSRAKPMRHFSECMALLDFLEQSIFQYSRPNVGQFEWPVWIGQVSVEGSRGGTRLRNTARVVLTSPMQRPSFIPGSSLLKNQTPSTAFRSELYNMIPVPPWGCLRPLSDEDAHILRPVVDRLESQNHVAVPTGFHHSGDILDVRIITSQQAERLLNGRSWRPRTDWIVTSSLSSDLICCWQDDSTEPADNGEYLAYIIDLLKARQRLTSVQACCREYQP